MVKKQMTTIIIIKNYQKRPLIILSKKISIPNHKEVSDLIPELLYEAKQKVANITFFQIQKTVSKSSETFMLRVFDIKERPDKKLIPGKKLPIYKINEELLPGKILCLLETSKMLKRYHILDTKNNYLTYALGMKLKSLYFDISTGGFNIAVPAEFSLEEYLEKELDIKFEVDVLWEK